MNTTWKDLIPSGKRLTHNNGYLCFYDRRNPLANPLNGRVFIHHYLINQHSGRQLREGQIVFFQDGNPENLEYENLVVMTRREMVKRRPRRLVAKVCQHCNQTFYVPAAHQDRRTHCSILCRALDRQLFEVSAEELHELVWSQPATEVARLFGVSDKAIEKRCKKLGVKKPPRGYWSKIAADQRKKEKGYA